MDVSLGIRLMSVQEIYKSTPHQMKHIKMLKAYHQVYLEKKGKTTLEVLKKTTGRHRIISDFRVFVGFK